jgi:hypothetical protein
VDGRFRLDVAPFVDAVVHELERANGAIDSTARMPRTGVPDAPRPDEAAKILGGNAQHVVQGVAAGAVPRTGG